MAIESVAAWLAANPQAIPAITTTAGTIYESLFPDEAKKIQMDVLEEQRQFRRMLSRQSRGIFSVGESEGIMRGAEPTVNRIAGGVARRGLGGSGAGQQVIAQAQQAPFTAAQQAATQALTGAASREFEMASQLVGDDSFYEDLGATVKNIVQLVDDGDTMDDDVEVDGAIGILRKGLEALSGLFEAGE